MFHHSGKRLIFVIVSLRMSSHFCFGRWRKLVDVVQMSTPEKKMRSSSLQWVAAEFHTTLCISQGVFVFVFKRL